MGYLKNIQATNHDSSDEVQGHVSKDDFDTFMYQKFSFNHEDFKNNNNLKTLNKYILDVSNNIETYIKSPIKELLLLINIIELDDNKENIASLIEELKNCVKIIIKNCNDILHHRFDIIEKNINSKEKTVKDFSQNTWNSQLFIELVILVHKICKRKKIDVTNEKVFLCITEIYFYFNKLSANLDPKFVNWFIEKFLCNSNDHMIL
jgi:hypothetical protein